MAARTWTEGEGYMQEPQPRLRRLLRAAGLIGALALAPAAQATPYGGGTAAATTWSPVASTIYQHYDRGPAAAANGKVYVMDSTVEAYTPASNSWSIVTSDPIYHGGGAAAVTGSDGRIYVFGGSNVPTAAEAYNPVTNAWTTLAAMPTGRYSLAAALGADGRIYAMGGYDSERGIIDTVEAYNPGSNTWATVA